MDPTNKSKRRQPGHSYFLERKEHISIEGRGNVFIKNTQTQVRELYRRHVAIEPEKPSSSQGDTKILETCRQVKTLNNKIEDEIDKLKNFRDCFLQDKETRKMKPAQFKLVSTNLRSRQEKYPSISCKETPTTINRQQTKHKKFSSPDSNNSMPYFRTMRVAPSPISGNSEKHNPKKKQSILNPKSEEVPREKERMGGGCSFGYNECMPFPSSVYQCDYDQGPAMACQSSAFNGTYHCYPGNCRCHEYPAAVSVPYSPNPCYQYHQQVHSPDVSNYACPRLSCSRRTTDLNTEEFCRNLPSTPTVPGRRTKSKSRSPSPATKRNRNIPPYPTVKSPRNEKKIMKVSLKKPHAKKTTKHPSKSAEEKVKIEDVEAKKPTSDSDYTDQEKMRLHREYMEMYKQEHEKTAKIDSSPKSSDLDIHPTYTKLSTETNELGSPSNVKSQDSGFKQEPQTNDENSLNQLQAVSQEDVRVKQPQALENSLQIKEEHPLDPQSERRRVMIHDTFQKRTVFVKRQDVQESMSLCQNEEVAEECVQYVSCASGPEVVDIGLNCCLNRRSSFNINASPCTCPLEMSINHQSCQTSPGKSISDFGYQSQYQISRKETPTQTDLLATTQETFVPTRMDLRNAPIWNDQPTQCLPMQQMSQFTEKTENCEVSYASQHPLKGNIERKYQSEPYIRTKSAGYEYDTSLSLSRGQKQSPRQDLSLTDEGPSSSCKSVHCNDYFSSPMTSATGDVFSFPERTQLSLMSESLRSDVFSAQGRSQMVGASAPLSSRTFNRSEEDYPDISLQLNPRSRQVCNSPPLSSRTFNRSEEDYPDFSLQLNSQSRQICNSPSASNRTFNRSEANSPHLTLHDDSRYNELIQEKGYRNDLDSREHLMPTKSKVCEKRTRSVTFYDESGISQRDWEGAHSTERDGECSSPGDDLWEHFQNEESSFLIDSCRSSSTAELTCTESNCEENYISCTESKTEHIPPFNACPCMRKRYMMLAALSQPLNTDNQ